MGLGKAHPYRKQNRNFTKHVLRWNPQRKRKQGLPRNSWRRTVDNEVAKAGYSLKEIEKLAQDRRWRAAFMDLCSTGSERECVK